ncbi:hypothetical protein [Pontibacillus halophilus]|nr:hypothetical protein [Pontibacillus halophilus]
MMTGIKEQITVFTESRGCWKPGNTSCSDIIPERPTERNSLLG